MVVEGRIVAGKSQKNTSQRADCLRCVGDSPKVVPCVRDLLCALCMPFVVRVIAWWSDWFSLCLSVFDGGLYLCLPGAVFLWSVCGVSSCALSSARTAVLCGVGWLVRAECAARVLGVCTVSCVVVPESVSSFLRVHVCV